MRQALHCTLMIAPCNHLAARCHEADVIVAKIHNDLSKSTAVVLVCTPAAILRVPSLVKAYAARTAWLLR